MSEAPNSPTFGGVLNENKTVMQSIKDFENAPITTKARNIAFVVLIVAGVFFGATFFLQIINGIFAFVLLGLFGVGAVFAIRFLKKMDPLIQQKTKNLRLELMYEEARKNAAIQLDNQVLSNHERLLKARGARDAITALVNTMESDVADTDKASTYYAKKKRVLTKIQTSAKLIEQNIAGGAKINRQFEQKVVEYKKMDKFNRMAEQAAGVLSGSGFGSKMDEMLSLTAFEAIDEGFNGALATIENTAKDMELDGASA